MGAGMPKAYSRDLRERVIGRMERCGYPMTTPQLGDIFS
jgi:hypothetical protein